MRGFGEFFSHKDKSLDSLLDGCVNSLGHRLDDIVIDPAQKAAIKITTVQVPNLLHVLSETELRDIGNEVPQGLWVLCLLEVGEVIIDVPIKVIIAVKALEMVVVGR